MRWRMLLLVLLGTTACGKLGNSRDNEEVYRPDPDPDPAPLTCSYCVDTPPATYTGPSNFWMGLIGGQRACPAETPLLGLEGFLLEPTMLHQYARECRITPTDSCEIEGKVCAPAPDPDYQTCIHHTGDTACPVEYPHKHRLAATAGDMLLTLCCQPSPIAG